MRFAFERLKLVLEPSGASALAALLPGKVERARPAHRRDPVGRQRRRRALPRADRLGSAPCAPRSSPSRPPSRAASSDDRSGPVLAGLAEDAGCEIVGDGGRARRLRADRGPPAPLRRRSDCDLIFTTGGTGMTPDDITPEATRVVIHREAPGLAEAMRAEGARHTPLGILTRGIAGHRRVDADRQLPRQPEGGRAALPRDRAGARARGADPARRLQPWQPPPRRIAPPAVALEGVGRAYGERVALRDVTLTLPRGRDASPSSAPTAPARRRCCGSSPTLLRPHAGRAARARRRAAARGVAGARADRAARPRAAALPRPDRAREPALPRAPARRRARRASTRCSSRSAWPRAPTTRCARSRAG